MTEVVCLDCESQPAVSVGWNDDGSVRGAACGRCALRRQEKASEGLKDGAVLTVGPRNTRIVFYKGYHNGEAG